MTVIFEALQDLSFIAQLDIQRVNEADCGLFARIAAALEARKTNQILFGNAQALQDSGLEFGIGMIKMKLQVGKSQHE